MDRRIPESARNILRRLNAWGYEAYFVGGCVRDLLRGEPPHDWDVCTSARPEQVTACFTGERVLPTGLRHGTVTVLAEGIPYEITTFRQDGDYSDGRRPDGVRFVTGLTDDLARRDFTMNAVAMDGAGEMTDPFGGAADIRTGVIRCVGEPERRFGEDGLRVLRALRFSAVLGFGLEEATARAVHRCRGRLGRVSAERIQEELKKLLTGKAAGRVLRAYPDVLAVFWPELTPMVGFDQRSRWHTLDVWEHTVTAVEHGGEDLTVRLALLLHDVGKPECFTLDAEGEGHFFGHAARSAALAGELLTRLRFDRATVEQVTGLVARHDAPLLPEEKAVRRWLNRFGPEWLRRLIAVQRGDVQGQHPSLAEERLTALARVEDCLRGVLERGECFSRKQLAVDGRDVLAAGAAPGPAVGEVLDALLARVLEGALPNRREALLPELESMLHARQRLDSPPEGC